MMYVRIFGAFLVMLASTGMGMYFGSGIKDRLAKLQMLKQHFQVIRGDISYSGTTLPEAIGGMAERLLKTGECMEFQRFYQEAARRLQAREGVSFQTVWEEAIEHHLRKTTLTQGDLQLLSSLGGQFGYLDREMQLKTIDLYLARLEEERSREMQKAGEKMRLYHALGILAGAFLVVVMI